MIHSFTHSRGLWLGAGLLAGLVIGGLWPSTPLHAVATDRYENFAICTTPLDSDVEGLYFLDFLTGDLKAAVLSVQTGKFNSFFEYNVMQDLGGESVKNPRFLMVSGIANLRRAGGQIQPGQGVIYVAELTSGRVAAYMTPWSRQNQTSGQGFTGRLVPLDVIPFRTAAIRGQ